MHIKDVFIYWCEELSLYVNRNDLFTSVVSLLMSCGMCLKLPLQWTSVHWLVQYTLEYHLNATRWHSVREDTTVWPSEYLQGTLEHNWKNLIGTAPTGMPPGNSDYCSLPWNTTGGTITASLHTQAHIVNQSSTHDSLKWQDGGTPSSKWSNLCKFSFYLEFTALQWIPVLLIKRGSSSISPSLSACFWYEHHYSFCVVGVAFEQKSA